MNELPVKEGQELVVCIESVGQQGDGVVKVHGYVLFVPGTKRGERCRVRVTRTTPKFGFAEKVSA